MTSLRTGTYVDSNNICSTQSRAFVPGFLTALNGMTGPGTAIKPITRKESLC